jgi:hypothetical protein
MCDSDELVFRLEKQQEVDVLRLHLCFAVDANQKPHAHDVDEDVNIRHEVLVDGRATRPLEEGVDVEACGRVLDRSSVTDQLAVVARPIEIDLRLLEVSGQINLVHATDLPDHQARDEVEQRKQHLQA